MPYRVLYVYSEVFASTLQQLSEAHMLTAVPNEEPTVIESSSLYLSAQKVSADQLAGKSMTAGDAQVRSHFVRPECSLGGLFVRLVVRSRALPRLFSLTAYQNTSRTVERASPSHFPLMIETSTLGRNLCLISMLKMQLQYFYNIRLGCAEMT